MQKKIIAVAVAGLSTAAFAQTNVTIYGVADISGQGYSLSQSKAPSKVDGGAQGNVFSVQSNSSLIGFKGTEDLGNGLKALFQAETTLNLAGTTGSASGNGIGVNNSTAVFSALRDSYVGLNSKYGTAMAGYLSTPFRSSLTSFDVMPGATGSGSIETLNGIRIAEQGTNTNVLNQYAVNAIALSSSIRATAIAYAMPTLYGFDASIAYTGSGNNGLGNNTQVNTTGCGNGSNDVSACSQTPQSAWGMNLGWTGYGVNIKGAFQQANVNLRSNADPMTSAGAAGLLGDFTSYLVGAGYTGIAGLKTSVVYTRNSLGINANAITVNGTPNGAGRLSNNQLYAGASYRMGNWEPRISATWSSGVNGAGEDGQLGARQWTLNTGYYLSKRTQVYGLISNLNNSANQNYQMGQQANALKPTGGQNLFTYGMGMRTTF